MSKSNFKLQILDRDVSDNHILLFKQTQTQDLLQENLLIIKSNTRNTWMKLTHFKSPIVCFVHVLTWI